MKRAKIIALILAVLFAFSFALTACDDGTTVTIKLSYSGGTGSKGSVSADEKEVKPSEVEAGVEFTLKESTGFSKGVNEFDGWKLPDGTVKQPGDKITITSNTTVTATWKAAANPNETAPLVLATSTMDGVFNPFFYSNAYDGDVVGMIYNSLLSTDANGAIVAGEEYPTIALDYTVADGSVEDEMVYTFVIKNGLKFSDGTAITADDVLFNYYVYLDPSYTGSSTMYTQPIKGLGEYRNQDANYTANVKTLEAIIKAGKSNSTGTGFTAAQHKAFWDAFEASGVKMTEDIIETCVAYMDTQATADKTYAQYYTGKTGAELKALNFELAWSLFFWGFGSFVETGTGDNKAIDFTKIKNDITGQTINVSALTKEIYWETIKEAYTDDDGLISSDIDGEAAGEDLPYKDGSDAFFKTLPASAAVTSIAGITKGTKTIDGVQYETVVITCTEKNPKTILSLGVTVAPKAYYTKGYTYKTDGIVNFGCELGLKVDSKDKDPAFMNHLKTFNSAPVGSGAYKMGQGPTGVFYEDDSIVYFVRNEQFATFGLGTAKIKNVRFKVITMGSELTAVQTGEVHYASPSATSTVLNTISNDNTLTSILVDNLGYGYICVNPKYYGNINERIALNTIFDLDSIENYYPNGLADVIYRSMSQVSWAYPEGAKATYEYDATGETALEYFKKAGYTVVGGQLIDPDTNKQAEFKFTLPSAAADHPAGSIFLQAKTILEKLGAKAEIVADTNLIANIKGDTGVAIYALAWQAALDPDMYQVNHYESQAESVISNGIVWLHENGGTVDLGTIEWEGKTLNQKQALEELGKLIEEGLKYMLPAERKPIYEKALDLLALLAIEIPTYQRKNLLVYDHTVISAASLSDTVTPYWGPMAEIWNVEFAAQS